LRRERPPFIGARGTAGSGQGRRRRRRSRATKGQGVGSECGRRQRECRGLDGAGNGGLWRSSLSSRSGARGGWSSSMATVTGLWRANGDVQEVEGTVVSRRAHGESEGRREALGHSGVLSRPGMPSCASWRATGCLWARLGTRLLACASVGLTKGGQGLVQER
jgi:hypothetical protein